MKKYDIIKRIPKNGKTFPPEKFKTKGLDDL